MSWFDTSGIASFAKSALKEAQRTIDKALDIQDDDIITGIADPPSTPRSDLVETKKEDQMADASVWGSFSGSYFDVASKRQEKIVKNGINLLDAPLASPEEVSPNDVVTGFPSKYSDSILSESKIEDSTGETLPLAPEEEVEKGGVICIMQ